VLASALASAAFCVFAASHVAATVPNQQLTVFEQDFANKIVLIIDVPKKKIKEVTCVIMARHPELDAREAHTTISTLP
jgi:hypothetical protein